MKIDVFDYRKMEGGRATRTTVDCPPELEDRLAIWNRNGWVVGLLPADDAGPEAVACVDYMSDVVLHRLGIVGTLDAVQMMGDIATLFGIDPPVLTAKYRAAVTKRPDRTEEA